MPIHLAAPSRRCFLKQASTVSAAAILALQGRAAFGVEPVDPNFIALLSDTHIANDPGVTARGVNMSDNLNSIISQISKLSQRPANLIINGDCAYLKGQKEDYENLSRSLEPLEPLQIGLHVTMGNHDDRDQLYQTLTKQRPTAQSANSKHLSVIEGEFANWYLLDSLTKVNVVTGELGSEQRMWLAKELDARKDKPAVVMAHHNPQFDAPAEGTPWSGIADTAPLFELLEARPHVRAFIFGHTHTWKTTEHKHIKLINLPPVAYVFSDGQPNGWVTAKLSSFGMQLQLQTLDAKHPNANETVDVAWNSPSSR
jgi:3',5'-cyclic-AMP phosphodiesterase